MITNRLAGMKFIGVDRATEMAEAADDENILRMENLDTDLHHLMISLMKHVKQYQVKG
jgi:hypothetical protein